MIDNVDRGEVKTWNIAVERRLMFDTSVDVADVGAKGSGGYAALDINAPQTLGVGDVGRPYAPQGRLLAINSWGQRLKTDDQSLQVAVNKPFTHGLLFKGADTLSTSMNETDNDGNQQTANLVGTFDVLGAIGASGRWFDTSAFAQPTGVRFGNTGRNQFYAPGGWNLDFSLFHSFPVGGVSACSFRLNREPQTHN